MRSTDRRTMLVTFLQASLKQHSRATDYSRCSYIMKGLPEFIRCKDEACKGSPAAARRPIKLSSKLEGVPTCG